MPSGSNLPAIPARFSVAEWQGYLGLIVQVPDWFRNFVIDSRCRYDGTELLMDEQTFIRDGESCIVGVTCTAEEVHYVVMVGFLKLGSWSQHDQAVEAVEVLSEFSPIYATCPKCSQNVVNRFRIQRFYFGYGSASGRCSSCNTAWTWDLTWRYQDPIRQGPAIEDEDFHSARLALEALNSVDFGRDFRDVIENYGA